MPIRPRIEPWEIPENGDPDRDVWLNAEMDCVFCFRKWVATFPVCAPSLECPSCGYMNERPDR